MNYPNFKLMGKASPFICLLLAAPFIYGTAKESGDKTLQSPAKASHAYSNLPEDPAYMYDIDGDGVLEWVTYTRLNKFSNDLTDSKVLNGNFCNVKQWVNFGDENIGVLSPLLDYSSDMAIYKTSGNDAIEAYFLDAYNSAISVLDYDNDGQNDFWIMSGGSHVLNYMPNGEFSSEYLTLLTPEEYYDYVKEHGGGGLGSGMSVVGGDEGGYPGAFCTYQNIDINNDGYPDFIDPSSGVYLMNIGDGRFVKDSFAGRVIFRDFNGDSLNDMISYDESSKTLSLIIQQKEGDPVKSKLLGGFSCSDVLWCHDFDCDGDIDILVPFNAKDNNGQSFLVMLENKGDGTFKKHENFIDGSQSFKVCKDIDNDGNYEVLSLSGNSYYRGVNSYKINGMDISTQAEVICPEEDENNQIRSVSFAADIDNSGIQRIFLDEYSPFLTPYSTPNTRPDTPAAPKVDYNAETGEMAIEWGLGSDKETAPLDLTYEVRIGTAPDKCDIVWTDALPDGRRRNALPGNSGYSLQRRFDATSWPMGKIYVSVQTVDDNGMGSQFSDYAVIDKKQPASGFIINSEELTAPTEECVVMLKTAPEEGVAYEWDFDGATVTSDADGEIHLHWLTPGEKTVTQKATSPNGDASISKKNFEVIPAKLVNALPDYSSYNIYQAVDLDLDGVAELFTQDNFLEGSSDGTYSPLKKLFNNQIHRPVNTENRGGIFTADINQDGLPDLYLSDYNGTAERWIEHLINEGDKSMEVTEVIVPDYSLLVGDLDNDGFADSYKYGYPISRNSGDYINFIDTSADFDHDTGRYSTEFVKFYDYDNDGLLDIITTKNEKFTVYKNNGDFNFSELENLEYGIFGEFVIGDIDSNGKMDFAWTDAYTSIVGTNYSDYAYVRWSDGTLTEIPAPSGHQFDEASALCDFDNNGCLDLVVSLNYDYDRGIREYMVIFFNIDHTYTIQNMGKVETLRYDVSYRRSDNYMGFSNLKIIGAANTLPTAPTSLRATQNDDALVIEWDAATDAETPYLGLRYNISIKKKDAEGEGAYFWSPLNGGLNGVPVPTNAQLLNSTMLTLPNGVIAPGEYEVKVQAVDSQREAGDFSEVFMMKVVATNLLNMPEETMVGKSTEIKMSAGYKAADFNFGPDAVIDNEVGSTVWVRWTSEGEKTITCDEYSKTIYVHPALNAYFYLPEQVISGATVRIECDNLHNSEWASLWLRDFEQYVPLNQNMITYTEIDDSHIELIFRRNDPMRIKHTLTEAYGSDEFTSDVRPYSLSEKPQISIVDIDEASGCHRLNWSVPSELYSLSDGVNIYKEGSTFGEYDLVATVPLSASSYVDTASDPSASAARYCISYALPYGETALTAAHRPTHLDVNNGGENVWNLYWEPYEGLNVNACRILRGASPIALECIAEVSGSASSYADFNAPAGDIYYAVEIIAEVSGSSLSSRSNMVYIADTAVDAIEDDSVRAKLSVKETSDGEEIEVEGIIADEYAPAVLRIYNPAGQLIYSELVDSSSVVIPIGSYVSGVYIVVVEGTRQQKARFMKH